MSGRAVICDSDLNLLHRAFGQFLILSEQRVRVLDIRSGELERHGSRLFENLRSSQNQLFRVLVDPLANRPDQIVKLGDKSNGRRGFRVELDETTDAQRMEPQQPLPRTYPVDCPA